MLARVTPFPFVFALYTTCAAALDADFTIPSSWNGTISHSAQQINDTLQGALGVLTPLINRTTSTIDQVAGVSSDAFGASEVPILIRTLVTSDLSAGTVANHAYLSNLTHYPATQTYSYESLAFFDGYRAYGVSDFLSNAAKVWESPVMVAITNTSIGSCKGSTVAGAVLTGGSLVGQITADNVGAYLALTAYLGSAFPTNDDYKTTAALVANFIRNHLYDNTTGLLNDFYLTNCSSTPSYSPPSWAMGLAIEGLSVWANVTGAGEDWRTFINQLIANSIKSTLWTNDKGVIIEGSLESDMAAGDDFIVGGKGVFIKGLHEAWRRVNASSPVANLISAYINAQYNALVTMAAQGNNYSISWGGGPYHFEAWGQTAAISAFNAALDLSLHKADNATGAGSANGQGTGQDDSHSQGHSRTSAIAGGVAGGVVALGAITGLVLYIRKLHRSSRRPRELFDITGDQPHPASQPSSTSHHSGPVVTVDPFLDQEPVSAREMRQVRASHTTVPNEEITEVPR